MPRRTLGLAPCLPARWGRLTLSGLRLGPAKVQITAEGTDAEVRHLPAGWRTDDRRPSLVRQVAPPAEDGAPVERLSETRQ